MFAYVLGVAALIPLLYYAYFRLSCPQSLKPFPEVSVFEFIKRIHQNQPTDKRVKFVSDTADEEGLARFFIAGTWCLVVTNPWYIRKVLSDIDTFPKQKFQDVSKHSLAAKFLGNQVVSENGLDWKRHRRVVAPAFHNFQPYVDVFGHSAAEFADIARTENRNKNGGELDVSTLLSRMTIDIICKAGFSYNLDALKNPESNTWLKHYNTFMQEIFNPIYFIFPILEKLNFGQRKEKLVGANDGLNDIFFQMIDKRRQEMNHLKEQIQEGDVAKTAEPIKDLLALMIQAGDNAESVDEGHGGPSASLSPEEIRNNLMIFFIAGHETTANSLASTLYFLAVHPEIQEIARSECNNAMAGKPTNATATFEEQKKMVYLNGVIKESLRLNSPVSQLGLRIVKKPEGVMLGSHHLPYGTFIQLNMYAMHHNPDVWNDPAKFDPTRFLEKSDAKAPEDGSWTSEFREKTGGHMSEAERICWQPFGAGPRACLGMNFSLIEQRVFLSHILRQFRVKLPANSKHANGIINAGQAIIKPCEMKIVFEELKC